MLYKLWVHKNFIHPLSAFLGFASLFTLIAIRIIKMKYAPKSLLLSCGPVVLIIFGIILNHTLKLHENYDVRSPV